MAGHFFEYTDGKPVLWIGDTWWNWTDRRIHMDSFKQLVDDRAAKGFNIGQLFVPGNGWGPESSCWMILIPFLTQNMLQEWRR